MCNSTDHYDGKCLICGEITKVRHKNIWLIGSEGTDMCMPCERDLLKFLRARQRFFIQKKIEKLKKKARIKRGVVK